MSRTGSVIPLNELRQFPERPESEFEWEDLLLRLEIMPRALRVELERTRSAELPPILSDLKERELAVQQLLEEVAITADPRHAPDPDRIREAQPDSTPAAGMPASDKPSSPLAPASFAGSDVEHFVRLRGRNFAMLQRRGIDVWNWRVRVQSAGDATVFQLLSQLARDDVETLSRLREARTP